MKDQHCEEQAEVHSQGVLVSKIEGIHADQCKDEGHLDHEKE